MAKGLSSVQRTMQYLRGEGITCAVVEKFNPHVGPYGIRQDLFGIIDVLALDHASGVIGYQVCGADFKQHVDKFYDERLEECIDWLKTPGTRLIIMGWRKVKLKRGGKAMRWAPRIQEFTLEDFE